MTEKLATAGQTLEQATSIFKALADPNRLRILNQLMQGISCNGELNDQLGLPPNLLSHHLRVLHQAGLVSSRRDVMDGRWIYYSVNRETAAFWQAWIAAYLDPARIQERPVCGPEGQLVGVNPSPPLSSDGSMSLS
jgi:ArsR family transcriptional regulator